MSFTNDVVIGLEIHAELNTKSKLFCGCSTSDGEPNTLTCPTCLGLPGSKPVLNSRALEYALRLAMMLECDIAKELIFSRKTYFYPDLAKNFQITQYEHPLGSGGQVTLTNGTSIALKRVHLEEDPGALIHPGMSIAKSPYVLVDYNRSGHPLCEIVTEPVIETPEQAREFMKTLLSILRSLKIFDEHVGTIKADANVSIKESGYTRVEVKNVGSFKDIEHALQYEIARQKQVVAEGGDILVETRGYDSEQEKTIALRKKESEEDYGYITEPDLVPFPITREEIEQLQPTIPLTPFKRAEEMKQVGVSEEDAIVLSAEYDLAVLHEVLTDTVDPVRAAHIVRRDIPRILNYHKLGMEQVDPSIVKEILQLHKEKKITERTVQKLLEEYSNCLAKDKPFSPAKHVEKEGLQAVSDSGQLETLCKDILEKNPKAVEDYKGGNAASFNFLFGQVMRASKGRGSPQVIREILLKILQK